MLYQIRNYEISLYRISKTANFSSLLEIGHIQSILYEHKNIEFTEDSLKIELWFNNRERKKSYVFVIPFSKACMTQVLTALLVSIRSIK